MIWNFQDSLLFVDCLDSLSGKNDLLQINKFLAIIVFTDFILSPIGITLESMSGLIISSGVGITIGLVTLAIEVFFFKNR